MSMARALVVVQQLHLSKGLATAREQAVVGTLLGVQLAVGHQRVVASKALATGLTGKWTLSCMAADVRHDLVALGKGTAFATTFSPATHIGTLATRHMVLHDMSDKGLHACVHGARAANPLATVKGQGVSGGGRGRRGARALAAGYLLHFINELVHLHHGVKVLACPGEVCGTTGLGGVGGVVTDQQRKRSLPIKGIC